MHVSKHSARADTLIIGISMYFFFFKRDVSVSTHRMKTERHWTEIYSRRIT